MVSTYRLPPFRIIGSVRRSTSSGARAETLADAVNPGILAGSRVTEAEAIGELVAVAERLGAPVLAEQGTAHGRVPFPTDHPLYSDSLPLWSPAVHKRLSEFDVLLVVGMNLLRNYIYLEPARPIPPHIRLVQMDNDPWQIGKNYPVEVGLIGDLKAGLAEPRPTPGGADVRQAGGGGPATPRDLCHHPGREP